MNMVSIMIDVLGVKEFEKAVIFANRATKLI